MKTKNKDLQTLLNTYREIRVLNEVGSVLGWDQNTYMPPGAASGRADQVELLQSLITDRWNDPELLSCLEGIDERTLSDVEKAVMRQARRAVKYYVRVPKEIILKNASTTTRAFSIWQEARAANDFDAFSLILTEVFELQKTIAKHLGYQNSPYDALLDMYEPEFTTRDCDAMFSSLRAGLQDILAKGGNRLSRKRELAKLTRGECDQHKQQELSHHVMKLMGYPMDRGRLDISAHPFTTELGPDDIRITTRYDSRNVLMSLMPTIHEAGHALYELGISRDYERTPLAGGVSLGVHESQSRFWENVIGRSRAFAIFILSNIIEYFPHLADVTADELYAALNHVEAQPIRVEADELTYNFHVMLRYEIEKAVIEGDLSVREIPSAWNKKMKEYLDVDVEDMSSGCLQDVHWSYGSIGYFPTYTLGTIYSGQIWAAMNDSFDVEKQVGTGDWSPIREWLGTRIHEHGGLYMPCELMSRAVGDHLNAQPYLDYLRQKYA